MLYKSFTQLWFNNYESLILELLYQFSPCWASYISKKTALPRSSVYTSLNLLIDKGIVWVTYKNEVKQFIAEDISVLNRFLLEEKKKLDTKIDILSDIEDTINKIQNLNLQIPQIINYEWKEWLKKIYLDMLRNAPRNSTMYIIRNNFIYSNDWNFTQEDEWNNLSRKLKEKKNIKTLLILNDSDEEREKEPYYKQISLLEYKFINEKYNFTDYALYILDDTISMISLENNNLVWVRITNKNLANNHKNIFNSLWDKI